MGTMLTSKLLPYLLPRMSRALIQKTPFHTHAPNRTNFLDSLIPANLKGHTAILPILIEPPSKIGPSYITPTLNGDIERHIFGIPITIPPEIREPTADNTVIIDPDLSHTTKIEAHKRDLYWRRRGMKHHRYLRWRKRNETMLAYREIARQQKRENRKSAELENVWRNAGLEKEPPTYSEHENTSQIMKWRELGIWGEALTAEEIFEFATPPDPPNKKTYIPRDLNIRR